MNTSGSAIVANHVNPCNDVPDTTYWNSMKTECTVCGTAFSAGAHNAKACSDACRRKAKANWSHRYRTGAYTKTHKCHACRLPFTAAIHNKHFCSVECKRVARRSYDVAWKKANKEKVRATIRTWEQKNPHKKAAHAATTRAIGSGALVRGPCRDCGAVRTQAHHADYKKPLAIIWLCASCHAEEHRKIRALQRRAA